MAEIISFIAAVLLFLVGVLGIFLPLLPGVPVAWIGFFIYAAVTDFTTIPLWIVFLFLGATILTVVFDFVAPVIGARRWNASRYGVIGASIGLLLGIFFAGPFGIVIGPIAGAFLGEIIAGRTAEEATRGAVGTFIGFLAGTILKLGVIAGMAGFLIASLF
ncbi:MAG: DUF456 domain-containing protein [Patescibacteria group bacterium]